MSESKSEIKSSEKTIEVKTQMMPQEKTTEGKQVQLNESFAGKTEAVNQGISLKPLGSHASNPFSKPQDVQVQPLPSQTILPQSTPPVQPTEGGNGNTTSE